MEQNRDIQKMVSNIFEEDDNFQQCIQKLFVDIENGLEKCGNDRTKISRLLAIRNFIETKIPDAKSIVFGETLISVAV